MITAPGTESHMTNIFIYTIPDDTFEEPEEEKDAPESAYIKPQIENTDEEILFENEDNVRYGATTLKGYAQYVDDSNAIHLKDDNDEFVLNIKNPQKIIT